MTESEIEPREGPTEDPQDRWNKDLRKETLETCRILYSEHRCWECENGWAEPLSDLSYELEALNITLGRKYGIRIVADQVKEKFGTLRFYYSVMYAPPAWTQILSWPFRALSTAIRRRTKFKSKYVNGRFVPTRRRGVFAFVNALWRIGRFLDLSFLIPETNSRRIAIRYMDNFAERAVDRAEEACFGRCEVCGDCIGTRWSARCKTKGWIRYVCEDCAKKRKWDYEKVGGGEERESPEAGKGSEDGLENVENDNC